MRRIRSGCCCVRRERPRGRCAAEERDELAAFHHSITSSASASSVGGTAIPYAQQIRAR
jgi:hypothetical protein